MRNHPLLDRPILLPARRHRSFFLLLWLLLLTPLALTGGGDDNILRGAIVLDAYRRAYPAVVKDITFRHGDWVASVNGTTFYWAHGRILPEEELENWARYQPYVTYVYPRDIRIPDDDDDAVIERLKREGDPDVQSALPGCQGDFLAEIAGGDSRGEIEALLEKVSFLGHRVNVNALIAEPLARVDAAVRKAAKVDRKVARFLAIIQSVGCYNWREISGTKRRSYHSLGLAVDILARRSGNAVTYWAWERERNENWMLVPLEDRWSPPGSVIAAFEHEGFIWGGKWDMYDTMHFEYRPELLILRDRTGSAAAD